MGRRIAFIALVMLSGCAYKAEVVDAPAYNVVSSYGEKIPGRWLLFVDAAPLNRPTKPSGFACSAHSFPIVAANASATSAKETIANLVETVEVDGLVDRKGPGRELGSAGIPWNVGGSVCPDSSSGPASLRGRCTPRATRPGSNPVHRPREEFPPSPGK